ncbi:YesL family protein [Fundicoccus sp. Sow4_H7]|uniref:YesL family protein n=1 Tax=Fundicoccus sp. Sow4_H7 TaxID=3438784 RepID=UPI003F92AC1B
MSFDGLFGMIFEIVMWLVRLIILNFLWIIFTVLGLGLFGIAPATFSLANVIYKWLSVGHDISFVKTFIDYYKENFFKSNKIGLLIISLFAFIQLDFYISEQFIQSALFHTVIVILFWLLIIYTCYLLVIFSRYELCFSQYFKQTLYIAFGSPLVSIGMLLVVFFIAILYTYIPILFFFMGVSLTLYPFIGLGYYACIKLERKIHSNN